MASCRYCLEYVKESDFKNALSLSFLWPQDTVSFDKQCWGRQRVILLGCKLTKRPCASTYECMYILMYVCVYIVYTHTQIIHTYIHIYIHACIHTYLIYLSIHPSTHPLSFHLCWNSLSQNLNEKGTNAFSWQKKKIWLSWLVWQRGLLLPITLTGG